MDTMNVVLIVFAGLCIGALVAQGSIPHTRILLWACSAILTAILGAVFVQSGDASFFSGTLFTVSTIAGACVYGAEVWKRRGLREAYSHWQLIWMSALRPGYLRASYEQSKEE